jgi:hypothetical protein
MPPADHLSNKGTINVLLDRDVSGTAGLVAEHDMAAQYGIDLDDLDPQHSLTLDPRRSSPSR